MNSRALLAMTAGFLVALAPIEGARAEPQQGGTFIIGVEGEPAISPPTRPR